MSTDREDTAGIRDVIAVYWAHLRPALGVLLAMHRSDRTARTTATKGRG